MTTTQLLQQTTTSSQPIGPQPNAWKHLLWKDGRTFFAPALIIVTAYLGISALVVATTSESQQQTIAHQSILAFFLFGMAPMWAAAAGAIITAADSEDDTDTWMRSLPVSPIRVFGQRVVSALGSVILIGLICAIGYTWCGDYSTSWRSGQSPAIGLIPSELLGPASTAAKVLSNSSFTTTFLFAGLFVGAVVRRVLPAAAVGALLAALYCSVVRSTAVTVLSSQSPLVLPITSACLAAFSATGLVLSAHLCLRATAPRLTTAEASSNSLTGLRRRVAGWTAPNKAVRSLLWRELVTLTWFVPLAMAATAGTFFVDFLYTAFALAMTVPLFAGLVSATADPRDKTLQFVTNHGCSPTLFWVVKTATWTICMLLAVLVSLVVVECALTDNRIGQWKVAHTIAITNPMPPTSVFASTYCFDIHSRNLDSRSCLSEPYRTYVGLSAAVLALTLFLIGQIAGFWIQRRVVALIAAVAIGIAWALLHTTTAFMLTPVWSAGLIPVLFLAILAPLACRDAVCQQTDWPKRIALAATMTTTFLVCVPASRAAAMPRANWVNRMTIAAPATRPTPSETTRYLFEDVADAFGREIQLPAEFNLKQLPAGSPTPPDWLTHYRKWLERYGLYCQLFRQSDGENNTETSQRFRAVVNRLHEFASALIADPQMPKRTSFRHIEIVNGFTVALLVDAELLWNKGKDEEAWRSWISAWQIACYFARHDAEWVGSNPQSFASPYSLTVAHRSRQMILNVLHDRMTRGEVPQHRASQIDKVLRAHPPRPFQELADAAYRVCLGRNDVSLPRNEQTWFAALVDSYFAVDKQLRIASESGVAVLRETARYEPTYRHLTPDLEWEADSVGIDLKELVTLEERIERHSVNYDPHRVQFFLEAAGYSSFRNLYTESPEALIRLYDTVLYEVGQIAQSTTDRPPTASSTSNESPLEVPATLSETE